MMLAMLLARFTPGESPLHKSWGAILGMIERLQRMEKIDFTSFSSLLAEDYWAR